MRFETLNSGIFKKQKKNRLIYEAISFSDALHNNHNFIANMVFYFLVSCFIPLICLICNISRRISIVLSLFFWIWPYILKTLIRKEAKYKASIARGCASNVSHKGAGEFYVVPFSVAWKDVRR